MTVRAARSMLVAGVMSGTSADGVDVALCRIGPGEDGPAIEVVRHRGFAYGPEVRAAVLRAMTDAATTVAEMARLNWRLGEVYADAVAETCAGAVPDLVGLHGQTIYHQGAAEPFLGAATRATWQTGEPAVVAERLGVAVVSDFRSADLAAGGQGAPLVPMLDFHFFRHAERTRILLNLGGIANITVLPAGCGLDEVRAFDTGPANMVLDGLMAELFGREFDRDGETAAAGRVLPGALAELLRHPYFAVAPPKSCGREQFGAEFAAEVRALCARESGRGEDAVRTAAELTAETVVRASVPFAAGGAAEVIVSGGGTRNGFLMERLRNLFAGHGVTVGTTGEYGLAAEAKEAVAFALLAWLSWHGLAGNVSSATGAAHAVVLGRISGGQVGR